MSSILFFTFLLIPTAVFSKDYYTAAVFEHQTIGLGEKGNNILEIAIRNLKLYSKAAEVAAKNGTDLILFNEYGLIDEPENQEQIRKYAENVPDPTIHTVNPCLKKRDDTVRLSYLSCIARDNKMYVVANMINIQECESVCHSNDIDGCTSECPDDGAFLYNTNVAFDREGNLIARYHKAHPFFESVDTPQPEFVTFDTEFGRFGMIVCFDSVFAESMELARDYGIDTLLFPTFWFDNILTLNAIEWQQAWALTNKVNFLGANTQASKWSSLGSGIYSKDDGYLVYTYENDGESKLLLANVRTKGNSEIPEINTITIIREDSVIPKVEESGKNFPEQCFEDFVGPAETLNDYRCFKAMTENFTLTKLSAPSGEVQACNNGLCCYLKYSSEQLKDDVYLAAFNGTSNIKDFYFWWEETCMLIRCDPHNNKECVMQPATSNTVFKSLELRAKFEAERVYPTVSKNYFRLAPKKEWSVETVKSETVLKFQSESKEPLIKVALMGRNYERDTPFIPFNAPRGSGLADFSH